MKNLHAFSLISLLLSIASVTLFLLEYNTVALFLSGAGIFIIVPDFFKYTRFFDFTCTTIAALILATQLTLVANPITGAAALLICASAFLRFAFWEKLGYTGLPWLETTLAIAAIVFYLVGNLVYPATWPVWVVPGILSFMALMISLNPSARVMLKNAPRGYAAETGKPAPDFSLPDQDGNITSLSDFTDKKNLLLIFVKGDWCPGCHMMLRCYEKNREKFQQKDIVVMAIGPDPVGVNREMVHRLGIEYKVLSDDSHKVVEQYGITIKDFPRSPDEQEFTALPASFLIDKKGIVRFSSRPDKAGEFLNPALIFPVLESLNTAA